MARKYQSTILVTGGTTGLGYHAALTIAKTQPETEVVIASRTDKEHAADSINAALKQSNVFFSRLDLSDQSEVRNFATEWGHQDHAPIAALVLNAGLQFPQPEPVYSVDGIEMTFAVNHVGHTLLFHLMQSQLAPDCRIVVTASGVHDPAQRTGVPVPRYSSIENMAHPAGKIRNGIERYSTSKLCNVLWTNALHRRIAEIQKSDRSLRWTANALDPGLMMNTSLGREWPAAAQWLGRHVLPHLLWLLRLYFGPNVHTPAESGDGLARLAVAEDVRPLSGRYFEGLREVKSSEESYDVAKQDELWQGTIDLIAKDETEKRDFRNLSRSTRQFSK